MSPLIILISKDYTALTAGSIGEEAESVTAVDKNAGGSFSRASKVKVNPE